MLRHWINERFKKGNLSEEAFRERVLDLTEANNSLISDLIEELSQVNAFKEAVYWACYYDVPTEEMPLSIRKLKEIPEDPNINRNVNYFTLRIPESAITIIDSISKLSRMIDTLAIEDNIIAIDVKTETRKISLIQIAIKDEVYLIDVKKIASPIQSRIWREFYSDVLINPSIVKIGFEGDEHLKCMFPNLPVGHLDLHNSWSYVDLKHLLNHSSNFPYPQNQGILRNGLSQIVARYLGKPLNEGEELSNWDKRPLRKAQIIYAGETAGSLSLHAASGLLNLHHRLDNLVDEVANNLEAAALHYRYWFVSVHPVHRRQLS